MKLRLLGTGTPTPSTKRKSSGYMIEIGDEVILFDHGPGSYHRMLETGRKPTDVTHLFFSHLHYDHCLDYGTLVLTRWDQGAGKIGDLKVYGPRPIGRMTQLLFGEDGVYGPDLSARTRRAASLAFYQARGGTLPRERPMPLCQEIKSGDFIEGNTWRVSVINAVHAQPELVCLAFRLDSDEGSVVYSGDTGPCNAMVKLAADCDVLIHMCHYISGSIKPPFDRAATKSITGHLQLAEIAHAARAKSVVVTHVTESIDIPGVRERVLSEIAQIYKGTIYFGHDLLEVPIRGPATKHLD